MPRDRVRVVWMEGPQAYGRTAADDAGFEAAFLAKELGRPVRVQWMRQRGDGLGHQGAGVHLQDARRARRAAATLVALDYEARAADHNHLGYNELDTVLIAQLTGMRRATPGARRGGRRRRSMYAIPNRRTAGARRGLPLVWETPLRTGNLRDPNGPQVDVRLRVVHRRTRRRGQGRSGRVPAQAAHRRDHGRQRVQARAFDRGASRRPPRRTAGSRGRRRAPSAAARSSPAAASPTPIRSQTVVAQIAEVEVNRRTGRVWVKRLVCAHDCGLVINPEALRAHDRRRHAALAQPRAARGGARSTPRR